MKDPEKVVSLIDFLIRRRDPSRGGVDGFDSDLPFDFGDLKKNHIRIGTHKELRRILNDLHGEWYKDRFGDKARVVGKIKRPGNKSRYILEATTTKGLKDERELILEDQLESWFDIRPVGTRRGKVDYNKSGKEITLIKRRLIILKYLIKKFRQPVTYNALIDEVNHVAPQLIYNRDREEAKKQLQDDVIGLRKRLNKKFNFEGEEAIGNVTGRGYILYR